MRKKFSRDLERYGAKNRGKKLYIVPMRGGVPVA